MPLNMNMAISKHNRDRSMPQYLKDLAQGTEIRNAIVTGRVLKSIEPCEEPHQQKKLDVHTLVDILNADGEDELTIQTVSQVLAKSEIFDLQSATKTMYVVGFQLKPGVKRPDEAILKRMDGKMAEWLKLNAQLSKEKQLPSSFPEPVLVD
jgi:hypothetical protein